ncbi:MAG: hypothetical protein ACUVSU_05525 [Aggregatilineaceae bacterium]
MLLAHFFLHPLLALSDSSGTGDFLRQVSGLIALTCVAGILWLGLMALVLQRAAERKRRAAQGLEPLPSLPVALYRRLMGTGNAPVAAVSAAPSPRVAVPLPDLKMLTGDLATQPAPTSAPSPSREPDTPSPAPNMAPPAANTPAASETAPELPAHDAVELLRVYRDLADGGLILVIGGQPFRSFAELRDADLDRRLQAVLRDLEALTGLAQPPAPAVNAAQEYPAEDLVARPPSMFRQMTRVAMGQKPEPLVPPTPQRSIAEEIEDLLQERLRDRPEFAGRDIHVRPALSGGVTIEVDGQFFEGVGEVTDEAVRALLTEVVRAWEQGQ